MKLKPEHIYSKIKDNQTPYWLLFLDLGNGRRATSPSDFFDPENVQGDLEQKIQASIDKLQTVIDIYKENLNPGEKAVFYITMRKDKRSNGETGKFEYTFVLTNGDEAEHSLGGLSQSPELNGYVSRHYVEQIQEISAKQTELKLKEFELERREKELAEKEAEIKEKEKKFSSESEKYATALSLAGDKVINTLLGIETESNSLGSADNEKQDDPKYNAVENLAQYIYDNTENIEEVEFLKKIVTSTIIKLNSKKNGVSEQE